MCGAAMERCGSSVPTKGKLHRGRRGPRRNDADPTVAARLPAMAAGPHRARWRLKIQAQPEVEAIEIAIDLKPLVIGFEHDMRRRVEIRSDAPHPIVILRPIAVVARRRGKRHRT